MTCVWGGVEGAYDDVCGGVEGAYRSITCVYRYSTRSYKFT